MVVHPSVKLKKEKERERERDREGEWKAKEGEKERKRRGEKNITLIFETKRCICMKLCSSCRLAKMPFPPFRPLHARVMKTSACRNGWNV